MDQFSTGQDHGLDHFYLDWTTHWTTPYSKFPGRVKKGLKNGPVRSISVDQFPTGPDHTLDCLIFQISWKGKKQGLENVPIWSISVDLFATGLDHGLDIFFWTRQHTGPLFSGPDHTLDCLIFQMSWEG